MAPHHIFKVYCVKNAVDGKCKLIEPFLYLEAFKTTAKMAAKWTVENTVLTYFELYFSQRNDFGVCHLCYDIFRKPLGTCSNS
jgi:hypothetical protein